MEKSQKAILIDKFGGKPYLTSVPIPELKDDEVLVKVSYAPIHPVEAIFMNGIYGSSVPIEFPVGIGVEGSGVIDSVGLTVPSDLIGKKVSFYGGYSDTSLYTGSYRQLIALKQYQVQVFENDDTDLQQLALFHVNPMTVMSFLRKVKEDGVTSVVQTAACSSVGKMIIAVCADMNLNLVNIVHKEELLDTLKDLGSKFSISTSTPTWKNDLTVIAQSLNATACFECLGGDFTGEILNCLPEKSVLYHYGNLEKKPLNGLNTGDFIFGDKAIKGWFSDGYLKNVSEDTRNEIFEKIKNYYCQSKNVFYTQISKVFEIENFEEAWNYYFQNMSKGKILIKPN